MTIERRFRKRYESGDTPWDAGQPDFNLIETVIKSPILRFFHFNPVILGETVQIPQGLEVSDGETAY
jgi:hypothetical protein